MRRALGLDRQSPRLPAHRSLPPTTSGTHRSHRRFVRDGEVPVVVQNREHEGSAETNKLDEAQQALREQIAAREQVERQLQDALATIERLQTQLVHERIAGQEAAQKAEAARLEIRAGASADAQ
jgi:hypothetical protein